MKVIETSKVFKSGRGNITSIPILIRKNLGIEKGDIIEWHYNTKTDELTVKVKKPVD